MPSFSVIIPAYQAAGTIAQAVESALDQTVPAHEVIICDDGSTDDLEGALAPYRDRITLIHKENGGGASALNAAASAASGDFVVVLDSDDTYEPERLEALGALAAARPDLDVLMTDSYLEAGGRVVGALLEGGSVRAGGSARSDTGPLLRELARDPAKPSDGGGWLRRVAANRVRLGLLASVALRWRQCRPSQHAAASLSHP